MGIKMKETVTQNFQFSGLTHAECSRWFPGSAQIKNCLLS